MQSISFLEWAEVGGKEKIFWVCGAQLLTRIRLFATRRTAVHQAPLSIRFSRQEYWSGLSNSPPGCVPSLGTEPTSLTSPALAGRFFTTSTTWEALYKCSRNTRQRVQFLSQEDPLEKGMATHSIILAWRIPWTEEPGCLQSMGSQESDTT